VVALLGPKEPQERIAGGVSPRKKIQSIFSPNGAKEKLSVDITLIIFDIMPFQKYNKLFLESHIFGDCSKVTEYVAWYYSASHRCVTTNLLVSYVVSFAPLGL